MERKVGDDIELSFDKYESESFVRGRITGHIHKVDDLVEICRHLSEAMMKYQKIGVLMDFSKIELDTKEIDLDQLAEKFRQLGVVPKSKIAIFHHKDHTESFRLLHNVCKEITDNLCVFDSEKDAIKWLCEGKDFDCP